MSLRQYNINGLCNVACDVDSPVGRSVDLHINHFAVEKLENGVNPDIVFHSELPKPSKDCVSTADGLSYDNDIAYMEDGLTAIRYNEGRLDVYTHRGLVPHPFIQIIGATKGFYLTHSAAISYKNVGILLPAWGGVGKTALVSNVVKDKEAKLLSDDFCFLEKNKRIFSYPLPFSVYYYHKDLFPELFKERKNRGAIVGKYFLPIIKAVRPFAAQLLEKHPRLEERVKQYGRGYSVVQVKDMFSKDDIGDSAIIKKVVWLERYKGDKFKFERVESEYIIRCILGVTHYEFSCGPGMRYLLTMASFGMINLADYFLNHRKTVEKSIEGIECLVLKIPENAPAQKIGDIFRSEILKNI